MCIITASGGKKKQKNPSSNIIDLTLKGNILRSEPGCHKTSQVFGSETVIVLQIGLIGQVGHNLSCRRALIGPF